MSKYKSDEMILSKSVCDALRMYGFFVFHPGNEGRRTIWEIAQWKANGGIAGVSDLIIVLRGEVVFVELKTAKGRQTPAQKTFQADVERMGHEYVIWSSLDDAIAFINKEKSKQ